MTDIDRQLRYKWTHLCTYGDASTTHHNTHTCLCAHTHTHIHTCVLSEIAGKLSWNTVAKRKTMLPHSLSYYAHSISFLKDKHRKFQNIVIKPMFQKLGSLILKSSVLSQPYDWTLAQNYSTNLRYGSISNVFYTIIHIRVISTLYKQIKSTFLRSVFCSRLPKGFGWFSWSQFWTKTLRVYPPDSMTHTGATDTLTPGLPVWVTPCMDGWGREGGSNPKQPNSTQDRRAGKKYHI